MEEADKKIIILLIGLALIVVSTGFWTGIFRYNELTLVGMGFGIYGIYLDMNSKKLKND